ncbi:MAG: DUF1259 domain-containing protein [Pseudobdellovibrionaceae bacterium]
MKKLFLYSIMTLFLTNEFGCSALAIGKKPGLDGTKISQLTGLPGQMNSKEGVYKVTLTRDDIKPTVAGVKLVPSQGLSSWVAFTQTGKDVMVMGDTVLTEDQVNPVMSVALENGLEVTALHNHFFADSPRVMFMHIGGMGDQDTLATAIGKVYAKVKETMGNPGHFPEVSIDASTSSITAGPLDTIFGGKGEVSKGVYKITIGRKTSMHGYLMGSAMGVNTWASFAGTDNSAVVDGDFAMLEGEVQNVLKELRKAGINIVALHNHMTGENPRIMFLHFWGIGSAADLAKGIKNALDTQNLKN